MNKLLATLIAGTFAVVSTTAIAQTATPAPAPAPAPAPKCAGPRTGLGKSTCGKPT